MRPICEKCGDSSMAEHQGPPGEGGSIPTSPLQLRKRDFIVAGVDMSTARDLIEAEHYARGASNTATFLHGLFPRDWLWFSDCLGVAWWIPPTKSAARAIAGNRWESLVSVRLAVAPGVAKERLFVPLLSKSVLMIDRHRWPFLVTCGRLARSFWHHLQSRRLDVRWPHQARAYLHDQRQDDGPQSRQQGHLTPK